jgi:LysR family transcriptional activator of nhaA
MNWLNYHHLYYFWLLSKEGTFTKVADRLKIAQSAVSGQILQLEESLEMSLLDRSNKRRPVLTEDGRKILEYANTIFETGEELQNWARTGSNKKDTTLKIGALSGLSRNFQFEFIKPILTNPNLKIEVTTGDQEKLIKMLKDHTLDLILSSHNVVADGRITLFSHVLHSSPLIFVTSKKNKIKNKKLKDALSTRRIYLPGKNFEARPELDSFLEKLKSPYQVAGEIDDIALLRLLALKSNDIIAIPQMGVINELTSKDLIIFDSNAKISQKFYAITRQKRIPNSLISFLISKMQ